MPLDSATKAALSEQNTGLFFALECFHPFKTFRLLDGDSVLTFGGNTYVGNDPQIGSLVRIDVSQDGVGNEAPDCAITIAQASDSAAISLSTPNAQGSIVKIYYGAYDLVTGLVRGVPLTWWVGELDVVSPSFVGESAGIQIDCVSGHERFFNNYEGQRQSNAFIQSVTPGDLGGQYVVVVDQEIPWGYEGARPILAKAPI